MAASPAAELLAFDNASTERSIAMANVAYGNGSAVFNLPHAGVPTFLMASFAGSRSIPAHAGEPSAPSPPRPTGRVDPRSRGGADGSAQLRSIEAGRSPLTRGSLLTAYHPGTYDTTFVVLFTCQGSPGELSVATAVRLVSTIPSRSTSSTGGIPKTLTDWPAGRSMESQTITILAFSSS